MKSDISSKGKNISAEDAIRENAGNNSAAAILRQKAEDSLEKKPSKSGSQLSEGDMLKLIHELEVHKIELELQNEELMLAKSTALETAEKYTELYDFAPSGYFTVSKESKIIDLNLTGAKMLGEERSRLKNRTLNLFISDDTKQIYNLFVEKVFASKVQESCEVILSSNGNSPLYVRLFGIITEKGDRCLITMVDITERKQAEEALVKAGALQSAIFNSANFSSIATDAKGVIQIFNVGAERMLGYTAAEVMNKITPADISDPQEVIARAEALSLELATRITPGFEALVFKAKRGIEDIYELTYIRKDGSRFPAVVSVTALRDDQDAIIGYLLIGTDNTARKQVEADREQLDRALKEKNTELESAKLVAEKASQAKSDFLSSMSHELRSPLNAILGFAQLMESGSPPPTPLQMVSIKQILKGGWYLLKLINEILDLSAIESGRLSLSLEPVSLVEVMLECRAMMEGQAQKRRIQMTFPQIVNPWFINADRTRIKQVLINLLSNAIKYNHEGGTVVVDCTAITPERIRISITDSGAGLSPKELAQLYQPFNRLGQEISGEEGTGIGLVVSKRLVELMDGVIGVESTVGVGSVFWIELMSIDASQIALGGVEPTVVGIQSEGPGCARLRTLLYVEDNPANMMLVEQIIARYPNIKLLTAVNGNNGIEMARISQPEVILMDINLPDISGSEAMKILRADPVTTHIPIIALSANAIPRDIKNSLEAGFFLYLTKPIQVNEFMDALDVAFKYVDKEGGQSK